jgi:hypothetical protein
MGEARKLIEDELAPWLRGRDGFHGLHVAQVGDDELLAFDVWNTKEDLDASKGEQDQMASQMLASVLASRLEYKEGAIVVHVAGHEPHAEECHAA